MVERGHFDGVAPDETVAYEFAKVIPPLRREAGHRRPLPDRVLRRPAHHQRAGDVRLPAPNSLTHGARDRTTKVARVRRPSLIAEATTTLRSRSRVIRRRLAKAEVCWRCVSAYRPPRARSSAWVPCSTIVPDSSTTIRSARRTEATLCETITQVRPGRPRRGPAGCGIRSRNPGRWCSRPAAGRPAARRSRGPGRAAAAGRPESE